jgi:hypothetical protein
LRTVTVVLALTVVWTVRKNFKNSQKPKAKKPAHIT